MLHLKLIRIIAVCYITSLSYPVAHASGESIIAELMKLSESIVEVRVAKRSILPPRRLVTHINQGAGLIIDSEGIIVTNAHLLKPRSLVNIRLADGRELKGRLVKVVRGADLAYFKLETDIPLPAFSFADSDKADLNQKVYNIGSSFVTHNTLSEGQITGIARQKTVRLNPPVDIDILRVSFNSYRGDSGSPLIDQNGRLLGMMAATSTGQNKVAYAIPSSAIRAHYLEIKNPSE